METITLFGNLPGSAKWIGGVLAPNGHIYGMPYDNTTILDINTETDTETEYPLDFCLSKFFNKF